MLKELGGHFEEEPKLEDSEGQKPEYNFELMKTMERDMVSTVQKMKEGIEEGRWSSLLSDDMGGRIPTLILRKILKEKGPSRDIKTYFLASGLTYFPDEKTRTQDYKKAIDYLSSLDFSDKRTLIVTEVIASGDTIVNIIKALRSIRGDNCDVACLRVEGPFELANKRKIEERGELFIGAELGRSSFSTEHDLLGGVKKRQEEYFPIPESMVKDIATDKDKIMFQKIINLARQDVDTMAKRVIEQVWK